MACAQLVGLIVGIASGGGSFMAMGPFALALLWGVGAGLWRFSPYQCLTPAIAGALASCIVNASMFALLELREPLDLPASDVFLVHVILAGDVLAISAGVFGGAMAGVFAGAWVRATVG